MAERKLHLPGPGSLWTLCGRKEGDYADHVAEVSCGKCKKLVNRTWDPMTVVQAALTLFRVTRGVDRGWAVRLANEMLSHRPHNGFPPALETAIAHLKEQRKEMAQLELDLAEVEEFQKMSYPGSPL